VHDDSTIRHSKTSMVNNEENLKAK